MTEVCAEKPFEMPFHGAQSPAPKTRFDVKRYTMRLSLTALALAAHGVAAQAQTATATHSVAAGLPAAVQKAIDTNPEVTVRLNALRAAMNEVDVARGGFYPTLDLGADAGFDNNRTLNQLPVDQSFGHTGISLTATQMLWDGQFTSHEVDRLNHAQTVRYFEFLASSEDTALAASQAYLDVLRYRRLVKLAEDNYTQHRYIYDQLQSKFKAGIGRGVDSEQANARLALAQSNLSTEVANLHDVSARYLRLVGDVPPAQLPDAPDLSDGLKAPSGALIGDALARNASISAAVENLRSVKADASGKESPFQPQLQARLRSGIGNNLDSLYGRKYDNSAELVLNWNLYKGGSDQARVRQYANLISEAEDQRDKACRDVRQTAAIAINDIERARQQLQYLDRNVLSIEKTRDGYRQQFDIGQRSLLDLLNAENELYTARRSYANADFDLQLANVRSQAARNTLVSSLGLSHSEEVNSEDAKPEGAKNWQAGEDSAGRCPASAVDVQSTSIDELNERADKMVHVVALVTPVAAPAPTPAAAVVIADAAAVQTVADRLRDWAQAWMSKDVDKYFSFYGKDFKANRSSHAKWVAERRRLVGKTGPIELKLGDVHTAAASADSVQTSFEQIYTSSNFKDSTRKVLTWKMEDHQWVIVEESNR